MNANLSPLAPITINEWLQQATNLIKKAAIPSARLDALILLEDELIKDRSWIFAHDDTKLTSAQIRRLEEKVVQRTNGTPLAYIRGFIEFYGRRLTVTPEVLIPRPETEELIEMALNLPLPERAKAIDVGTGSGCIAISLKLEKPSWEISATDISEDALDIAQRNSRSLHASVAMKRANLLQPDSGLQDLSKYDLVTANLPYVAKDFEISPDARAEPQLALFSEDEGYELIERLLPQAAKVLRAGGYLLLESDPWQQDRIILTAARSGFSLIERRRFHISLVRN